MMKRISFAVILAAISLAIKCQSPGNYDIFAVKYLEAWNVPAKYMAEGGSEKDTLRICFMVWFLRGDNGRNILVDAGMVDTASTRLKNFTRPDSVLHGINIYPRDITDIIITHPHYDHIGCVTLFPNARVWMQKKDFEYFTGGAWQEGGVSKGFEKNDVRNIIEINLQGRLKLVDGDNIEIMPGIRAYTGSKHTFENMYLVVNPSSGTDKVLLASDAVWFYYNLDNLLPATLAMDPRAYTGAMKRMKTLVRDRDHIIPGHDDIIFSKYPTVAKWIVKITPDSNRVVY